MGRWIELQADDDHRLGAWLAEPAGTPRGALVVVQEIFGVNSHIRAVSDGWAADGYLAVAPALFDRVERGIELGYTPPEIERGFGLKTACGNEAPLVDIAAAIEYASAAGRVGIVGFCWGGLLAWLAACKLVGLAAAVPYYGGGIPQQKGLAPHCPVLAHFGERDDHIPIDSVRAWAAQNPTVDVQLYAAGHGFNCDQRGSYDAPAAALARERTFAFLRRHVG
jgi:carboxymethylenebutenolidase